MTKFSRRQLLGSTYDDTKFEEGRALTQKDLDEAAPDHPVFVRHRGGHTAIVNRRAFELAGIKGSLTPGKLADIVIVEADPHEVDPDSIADIKILRTILGGKTTHEA